MSEQYRVILSSMLRNDGMARSTFTDCTFAEALQAIFVSIRVLSRGTDKSFREIVDFLLTADAESEPGSNQELN